MSSNDRITRLPPECRASDILPEFCPVWLPTRHVHVPRGTGLRQTRRMRTRAGICWAGAPPWFVEPGGSAGRRRGGCLPL